MPDIGYLVLILALVSCVYSIVMTPFAVHWNNWNLVQSSQYAAFANFFLLAIAIATMEYNLITSNFEVGYVWRHSSVDMPLFYKITALWGGLEGSLLFWATLQSLFTMIVAYVYRYSHREVIPYVLMTLHFILAFFLTLLVGWSNPFATQFPQELGRGLNPLLQNIAMTMHPPTLYLGYIGFSVPFAFAIGGLLQGKVDNAWVMTTRRWTLFAWYFLSMGLMIGGEWAYEELGWGGYWGWDPVENSALMPWLTGTAFLHSIMVQEKRNMLKIWNVVLIIATFALSILGTFLTRSGVVNSVHSFSESDIGPAFVGFLLFVLMVGLILIFWRIRKLESNYQIESVFCRENVFLAQNILFIGIAFTVLLGTIFPILAEAVRGTKLSIQAPFFTAVTAPMGYILFFLIGIGTLIAWRRASWKSLKRNFTTPAIIGCLGTAATAVWIPLRFEPLLIIWIACFLTTTIIREFIVVVRSKAKQLKSDWLTAFLTVINNNSRRYGGLIIHLGVVTMFLGFAGRFFDFEKDIALQVNRTEVVGDYQLRFKGIEEFPVRNALHRAAVIEVYQEGKLVDVMKPAKSFYPTQPDPLSEVAIRRSFFHDLYLVFSNESDEGQVAVIRVHINPMVMWAWMTLPLFTLGFLISMAYYPKSLVFDRQLSYIQHQTAMRKGG